MQQYKRTEFHGLRVCIVLGFSVIQSKDTDMVLFRLHKQQTFSTG